MKPTLALLPLLLAFPAWSDEPKAAPLELALLFDFWGTEGGVVTDGSPNRHSARMERASLVDGRKKPAVSLAGGGVVSMREVPPSLDPVGRAFTVGALVRPAGENGVVLSMGDGAEGFSLYLAGGVPHFAVRSGGALTVVAASEAVIPGQWVHLAGVVDGNGELALLVNTSTVARAAGSQLTRTPTEPLVIGADTGGPVADYGSSATWNGLVQDVRLYWGVVSRETTRELLGDWADRPGCGCAGNR